MVSSKDVIYSSGVMITKAYHEGL